MCGIAAIFSNKKTDSSYIKRMTSIIKHRGPNAEGVKDFFDGKAFLGHRRLSIIDLSEAGKQPMTDCTGRYWITYNGEIYNYLELKSVLVSKGYYFKTNTDTEVVIAAYDFWGKDCLAQFNGMWAFVIVDTYNNKIFAARDRMGVKPLYYWKSSEGFLAISSEIKQFTGLPGWKARINGQRVYDYLRWSMMDHTNETMFLDVYQLRRGEAVECEILGVVDNFDKFIYRWYFPIYEYNVNQGTDAREAGERFRALFFEAIKLRLRADVNIGSCLSGGLDSSSIVCVMNELLKNNNSGTLQSTITARSMYKKYDEGCFVDAVLENRGIIRHDVYPDFEIMMQELSKLTWFQDEPFVSTSVFAQWCVFSEAAKNGLTVMLDGQGADEQLAGYHAFFAPYFAGLFMSCQWKTLLKEIQSCKSRFGYGYGFALKGLALQLFPEVINEFLRKCYNGNSSVPYWLDMKSLGARSINPSIQAGVHKSRNVRDLSQIQLFETNLQKLLHYEDRNSMAHSIESRLPFLDKNLMEFVMDIPDKFKLSNGVTKCILRDGMKGIIPETVKNRSDKMGFVTPEEIWIRDNALLIKRYLEVAIRQCGGIIKQDFMKHFERIIIGEIPYDFVVWRVINLGNWIKVFNVSV